MGKRHRHQKNLKSEKAKVKLKATKTKHLPKGLNITDTSFKVKKISINEQLKRHDDDEILSRRNLNIKELLLRSQHYNCTVRRDAIRDLKEILSKHSSEVIGSQLNALLQNVSALSLDNEKDVRRDSFRLLNLILSTVPNERLLPFFDILISHLKCAATHVDPRIREDSLILFDVLIENCSALLIKSGCTILPDFLNMISKLNAESQPGRRLTIALGSKSTGVKWRNEVLKRLVRMLEFIVSEKKSQVFGRHSARTNVLRLDRCIESTPIFNQNDGRVCLIDFDSERSSIDDFADPSDSHKLTKHIKFLMPLLFDSWTEAGPDKDKINANKRSYTIISEEASLLLRNILSTIQLVIEYIEISESEIGAATASSWLLSNFPSAFDKTLFANFPYCEMRAIRKGRKRQEDSTKVESCVKCIEQNLAICHTYVWLSSVETGEKSRDYLDGNSCSRVLEYLNDLLESSTSIDNAALTQMAKLMRTLFFKASGIWYKNQIFLGETLRVVIDTYSRKPRKELEMLLFAIVSDIALDRNLTHLHSEKVLKDFIVSLPDLLLKRCIHENTIQMLNRIVLRYRQWIQSELVERHHRIIENAKTIEIVGSEDTWRSRLAICNLLYFRDSQVYY